MAAAAKLGNPHGMLSIIGLEDKRVPPPPLPLSPFTTSPPHTPPSPSTLVCCVCLTTEFSPPSMVLCTTRTRSTHHPHGMYLRHFGLLQSQVKLPSQSGHGARTSICSKKSIK